jgi:hypothetical protein
LKTQQLNRKAKIVEQTYYIVELWEDEKLVESRPMISEQTVHSKSYAENCAKNWEDYVF